jgi:hypothetical protein
MRKIVFCGLVILVLAAGLWGCKKIIRGLFQGIDADVPPFSITFPPIPFAPPDEVAFGTFTQQFNLDSAVRANTNNVYGANDVSSVKVKKIVFSLANADSLNNISNFESARFTFASNAKPDPVTIASITFPETDTSAYTYTPTNSPELKPYLVGSELYYNTFGKVRSVTTKPLTLALRVTLRVQ